MKEEHVQQIASAVEAVKAKLANGGIHHIYFVACGGSQASMMPIQYMFDREINIPSHIYTSNEFNYGTPKDFDGNTLVITVSHSGTTPETVAAAQKATDAGAVSICLSNVEGSPLWNAGTNPVHYDHGQDVPCEEKNNAILYTLAFELLKVLDPEHADRWQKGVEGITHLTECREDAFATYLERAKAWGSDNKREKIIYTMGSGANYGEMYSTASCWFMEMQWINSNAIHSGEYFHGPFEITDYDVPFIMIVSNGATRFLDERARNFATKFSKNVFVIDEQDFKLPGVDPSVAEYVSPIVAGYVVRAMVESIAHHRGHSLDVRRYMWQMEY